MSKCINCSRQLTQHNYSEKYGVAASKFCSNCREQRRMVWRNEWSLYKTKSTLSGREIVSYISPESDQVVYSLDEWFSADWDGTDYGVGYDFSKPFFVQFKELLKRTPHIPLLIGNCENSEYTNYSLENKNCYMISAADYNEDCYYSGYIFNSKDCIDSLFITGCELCAYCSDCESCYGSTHLEHCKNTNLSSYCIDCIGCSDCIGCIGLRNKQYCILNKQYSKEEFEKYKPRIYQNLDNFLLHFNELKNSINLRKDFNLNCENSTGRNLINCKNCTDCTDLIDSEDCINVNYGIGSNDCAEVNGAPKCELDYECVASPNTYNCKFCTSCWENSSSLTYSHLCRASKNCFGCVSLYQKQFCILNKQYSEKGYKEMIIKIIEHMKRTGEWGEFFPTWVSPFAYNETIAQDYYPITKDGAIEKGHIWSDYEQPTTQVELTHVQDPYEYSRYENKALECPLTHKPFKITSGEIKIYKKLNLPIPKIHPIQRHKERLIERNRS